MRHWFFLFLFLFLIFTITSQAQATLSVQIISPQNNSHIQKGSTVGINGFYTCDQSGYTLYFYVDGAQKGTQGASQGENLPFSFPWNTAGYSDWTHSLLVQLYKSGCDSASNSRNVIIVSLDHIEISPDKVEKIFCGNTQGFTVTGYDQFGNEFPLDDAKVVWSTNCGTMNPSSNSTSSTFTTGTYPKQDGKVSVSYDSAYVDYTNVRVYPKFGDFTIRGERDWVVFPFTFKIHGYVERLADSYGVFWGFSYPTPWFN